MFEENVFTPVYVFVYYFLDVFDYHECPDIQMFGTWTIIDKYNAVNIQIHKYSTTQNPWIILKNWIHEYSNKKKDSMNSTIDPFTQQFPLFGIAYVNI